MRGIIVDTNVYIDWINDGAYEEVFLQSGVVSYMSAVVLMELAAGASSPQDRGLVRGLHATFRRLRRLVAPSAAVFTDAGEVLCRLRAERGFTLSASNTIVNDVLIALSARSIGATVVTQNERDYKAIQAMRPFKVLIV